MKTKNKTHLNEALDALKNASLRQTQPRIQLLEALISTHGPFSVDEILQLPNLKTLDRVTVYRCLSTFEELGLVRRCEFGDGTSRYEYASEEHHHHHIVCKQCRKSQVIEACIPDSLTQVVKKMGYSQVSHSLEFFGICKNCS